MSWRKLTFHTLRPNIFSVSLLDEIFDYIYKILHFHFKFNPYFPKLRNIYQNIYNFNQLSINNLVTFDVTMAYNIRKIVFTKATKFVLTI